MGQHDPSTQNKASSSPPHLYFVTDVTKYSTFQEFFTLYYGDTPIGNSSIVSTIEFDRDGEFLICCWSYAKRIKVRLLLV